MKKSPRKKQYKIMAIDPYLQPFYNDIEPVSYTHLDVYKRQARWHLAEQQLVGSQTQNRKAVSYTHLDVYKRQLIS